MYRRVFNKTTILLGLAGYSVIISFPARPGRIMAKYTKS